jgi:hypothetical protein
MRSEGIDARIPVVLDAVHRAATDQQRRRSDLLIHLCDSSARVHCLYTYRTLGVVRYCRLNSSMNVFNRDLAG